MNNLCNFGRLYHEEQFCEIILILNQWYRGKSRFNVVLIWISGSTFVQRSVIICAILLEGIQRNNSVKLFCLGQWFRCHLKAYLSGALDTLLFGAILEESIIGNIHAKLYDIWTSGPGDVFIKTFLI